MAPNTEVLKWQRFFLTAGIPGTIASKYSKSFVEQRIQFTMLDDLDKSILIELGITTVGDQIAILRHISKMKTSREEPMDSSTIAKSSSMTCTKEKKLTSAAPDRDDIYHIHLPVGTTPKTRAILRKHNMLKSAGLLKRGSSGIRQSGKDILSSAGEKNTSIQSNTTSNKSHGTTMATAAEVSSTTDEFYDRMGVKGLISDQLSCRKYSIRVPSTNASSASLFVRAVNESTSSRVVEPVFRVRISEMGNKEWKPRGRATSPLRSKFSGAIRKQTVRNAVRSRNGLRSGVKTGGILHKVRPSVFERLG